MQLSTVGQIERETQNRVVALFRNELGYRYLVNWEKREDNSNIEEEILTAWFIKKGYSQNLIGKALYELGKVADDQSKFAKKLNAKIKKLCQMVRYNTFLPAFIIC
jgi:type I restriction enzyme, R subunit